MKSIKLNIHKILHNNFFRYSIIGAFCAFQNIAILYFLKSILNLHYIFATMIQMIFVNTIGFYLNRRYTFKTRINNFWHELWKYHSVMFYGFLMVLALMYLLVDIFNIWYLYAFIIVTVIMTLFNFIMHKNWTFK